MPGTNKYAIPAQQPNVDGYVDTYVGLPFDAISKAGDANLQQWDDTKKGVGAFQKELANNSGLKEVYGVPVPNDDIVQQRNSYYNNQVKELVDKYHGNYSDPRMQNEMSDIADSYAKDKSPNGIYGMSDNAKKIYSDYRDIESKNQDLINRPDLALPNKLKFLDYADKGGLQEQIRTGNTMDLQPSSIAKPVDVFKEVDDRLKGIEPVGGYTDEKGKFHDFAGSRPLTVNGVHYIQTSDRTMIPYDKILGAVEPLLKDDVINNDINSRALGESYFNKKDANKAKQDFQNDVRQYATQKYYKNLPKIDLKDNSAYYQAENLKRKDQETPVGNYTFQNQSSATGGIKPSYSETTNSLKANKAEMDSLTAKMKAGENTPENRARYAELQRTSTIQEQTLKHAQIDYAKTDDGKEGMKAAYNTTISIAQNHGWKIPTYGEFEAAVNKGYHWQERFSGESLGFYDQVVNDTKSWLQEKGTKKFDSEPVAYTANVITGENFDKTFNKPLTARVQSNATEYTLPNGQQLDDFLKAGDIDKKDINVSMLDKPINGSYAHQLTVRNSDGTLKFSVPIFPKKGATEQDAVGKWLYYNSTNDALGNENRKTGLEMMSRHAFPSMNVEKLNDEMDSQGGYGESQPFDLNINGNTGTYKLKKYKAKEDGKDQDRWQLYSGNQPVLSGKEKIDGLSAKDVQVKLFQLTHKL